MTGSTTRVSEEMLERLVKVEEKAETDPKRIWVSRMMQSAKLHYKRCPYFDHKTRMCFLELGGRCNRDGRFEGCPVFISFLERKYDEYKSRGLPLPTDFLDIA